MHHDSQIIGQKIIRYDQVRSTNDLAREFAEQGELEGLVVTAQEQIAGRGRLGRQWVVPRGTSLQFSVLLRPSLAPIHAQRIIQMAGLAVAQTLEHELHLQAILKWPNDVLLNVSGKPHPLKCCGILTETSLRDTKLEYIILGIGLNGNYSIADYPELSPTAITLQDALGQPVDLSALETALLGSLDHYYARVCGGDDLLTEYRARLGLLGQRVRVGTREGFIEGIARDVDADGALILANDHSLVKVYAGDVTLSKFSIPE